jgi:hypothetical protein
MALTPEGTPYVESSDLVANYPAASLSLANRVDLVGVLPFATSAARATAIPSPTDGQYSYLQDTNLTQFWNGSAWQTAGLTPGLNLVTPTSIANSGGSASVSGGAVTFTGVTSLSLNGVFTSAYDNYRFIVNLGAISTTLNMLFRLRASGTDATASNYNIQGLEAQSTTVAGGQITTDSFRAALGANDTYFSCMGDILVPALAKRTEYFSNAYAITSRGFVLQGARHTLENSYDGLTVYPSTGNFTGTIRVYGYQNS